MENVEIARVLREVADLLEIQGANPFRVRAYRNAARTIEALTEPLAEMVAEGKDLKEIPTIGEDISSYIIELVRTGRLRLLEQLRKEVPPSLAELMKLEGIGPKRAKALYEQLGVKSVADLERALERGKVEELPGFGKKMVQKLRRAIEDYKKHVTRFKLSDADQFVHPLIEYMRKAPGIEELEVAGSYRRRRETVGDLDLLAVCSKARPVMEHFTAYPGARVEAAGTTRGAIVLPSGMHIDIRILPRRSYGAALHYFTGSKAHVVAVRRLGVERGLKINEYGIFRVPKGGKGKETRIGGEREEEVFKAVGMDWVPPELRENRGEIEAALRHRLPNLITLRDLRGDLQMHTDWTDGANTIEEMARACREQGYEYIAITDHSRAVAVAGGLRPKELEAQWKEMAGVRKKIKGVALLRGMEVDILQDGSLDLPDHYLHRLDVVVVAVHSHMAMTKAKMTARIVKAISHPAVHILAHPTGRIINRREPYQVDVEEILQAAKELGVAVELNAQPDRLDLSDVQVQRAKELGVKVAINTDAHSVDTLRYMGYGVDQARRGWLEKGDVVNCMRLPALRKWLGRRRG